MMIILILAIGCGKAETTATGGPVLAENAHPFGSQPSQARMGNAWGGDCHQKQGTAKKGGGFGLEHIA